MGHKVNPKIIRIGLTQDWLSKLFVRKNYADTVRQDVVIRKYIKVKLKGCGIEKIEIERSTNELVLNITCAKPGIIIGRGGAGIEDLKQEIIKKFINDKKGIKINIQDVGNPNLSAPVVLESLILDIEKRMPFRRVMKQAINKVERAGALGVKVVVSGRLNGSEIARTEMLTSGKVPLHTLRADIDFAKTTAKTTYGAIGIKFWIYKGDIFKKETEAAKGEVVGDNK